MTTAAAKKPKKPVAHAGDLPCLLCGAKGPSNRRVTIHASIVAIDHSAKNPDCCYQEISRTCDLCPTHADELIQNVACAVERSGIPSYRTGYGLAASSVPSSLCPSVPLETSA